MLFGIKYGHKKAETLLKIFKSERKKMGHFTYQRIAQANKEPAEIRFMCFGIIDIHSEVIKSTKSF